MIQGLTVRNVRLDGSAEWRAGVASLWRNEIAGMSEDKIEQRLNQVVHVVESEGTVVGVSTAYKAYIKQLSNYLYAFRCFIAPQFRVPGLTSAVIVKTRDYLEEIHLQDGPDSERCVGVITLVENDRIMQYRREAIWPASKMVYIGNSPKGKHIRVYYFKGARI